MSNRKRTVRVQSHPITQMQNNLRQVKKEAGSKSNADLDSILRGAGWAVPEKRKDKVRDIVKMGENRFREVWKKSFGWDIDESRDPKKFEEHIRRIKQNKVETEE